MHIAFSWHWFASEEPHSSTSEVESSNKLSHYSSGTKFCPSKNIYSFHAFQALHFLIGTIKISLTEIMLPPDMTSVYQPVQVIPSPSNPALHMQPGVPEKSLHSAFTSHSGSQTRVGTEAGEKIHNKLTAVTTMHEISNPRKGLSPL